MQPLSAAVTHLAHPLTRMPPTPKDQNTLEFNGFIYRVTRLRSKALPDLPKAPTALTTTQKKQLLTKKQKDTVNLAMRLPGLPKAKRVHKLTERILKRRKAEVLKGSGYRVLVGQLKRDNMHIYEVTEADLAEEWADVIEVLEWFKKL